MGKLATLRVVIEEDFDSFGLERREEFLHDLVLLTGLERSDIREVRFQRGCVKAELRIPETAVEALHDLYSRARGSSNGEALEEMRAFLLKYNIANINGEFEVALQIRIKRPPIETQKGSQEIVFVHGFTGDGAAFGELPKFLSEFFQCRSSAYTYPTGWLTHSPSVYYLANGLDGWFRNHVQSERVAIIAHSMGGLVARKFITMQAYRSRPVDSYVKQLSFIASPHDGADLAAIVKKLPGLGSAQLDELSPRSGFIAELKEAWMAWLSAHSPRDCHVRSLYGTADAIVSPVNAIGLTPDSETILGADHTSIVKPTSADATVVSTLKRFLREAGFSQ
jgi:pimeloyl-ACP methyl ester carboxylesterase